MLRNKAKNCSRTEKQKNGNASGRPSSNYYRFVSELVLVSELFPVASNNVGGNSAVATGQVSWADETFADETTFRKMFGFALVGKEARVSRRGWCSPSAHNSAVGFQGEGVLGVYALNGTPVQSGKSKDVVNNNFRFGNFNAWIPEQQPSEKSKPNVNPDLGQQNGERFGSKSKGTNGRKGHGQNGHNLARAGSKNLRIHSVSFTQSAPEVGAAL